MVLGVELLDFSPHVRRQRDFLARFLVHGHVDGVCGADDFSFGVKQFVGKGERGLSNFFHRDLNFNDISDKEGHFKVGLGMHDGQEKILVAQKFGEAVADGF